MDQDRNSLWFPKIKQLQDAHMEVNLSFGDAFHHNLTKFGTKPILCDKIVNQL